MPEFQVTCINKPNRNSQHEHITHIGNTLGKWILTREDVIQRIDVKTASFYTVEPITGKKAYIGVVRETGRVPYLRTYADDKWNDNLLSLDECGSQCVIPT